MSIQSYRHVTPLEETLKEVFEKLLQELSGNKMPWIEAAKYAVEPSGGKDETFVHIDAMKLRLAIEAMNAALKEAKKYAK